MEEMKLIGKEKAFLKIKNNHEVLIYATIGIFVFLMIYGLIPLNVLRDDWVLNMYVEPDIIQHYAGWMTFRNSPWSWPLGLATDITQPIGNIISYTDSIPLFSIFFKLFSGILPATFQFFGWFILLCFVLQGVFAGKLVGLFIKNKNYVRIACFLFTLSPIMIERSFRHTALASHWLILASLFCYFTARKSPNMRWGFLILNIFAILIHPYFVPMVMGILCASLLEHMIKDKKIISSISSLFINIVCILGVGFVIGLFGSIQTTHSNSLSGYGFFSMNLNALFNPIGYIVPNWSIFLPARPQTLGNYDGFNYLGIGILIALLVGFIITIVRKWGSQKKYYLKMTFIKEYYGLCIACIIFAIYAVSNVVTFDSNILFTYPLPKILYPIFSAFQASSREFYPVFYLIYLMVVICCYKYFEGKKIPHIILASIISIQAIDMSAVLISKRLMFTDNSIRQESSRLNDEFSTDWSYIADNYKHLQLIDMQQDFAIYYRLAAFLGKHDITSNIKIMNRGSIDDLLKENNLLLQNIINSNLPLEASLGSLYLWHNKTQAENFATCLDEDAVITQIGPFYSVSFEKEKNIDSFNASLEKSKLQNAKESEKLQYSLETSEEHESYYLLRGWGFIENMDSAEQSALVKVWDDTGKEKYYPMFTLERGDVGEFFENDLYKNVGFSLYLDKSEWKDSTNLSLQIIIKNGDELFSPPTINLK